MYSVLCSIICSCQHSFLNRSQVSCTAGSNFIWTPLWPHRHVCTIVAIIIHANIVSRNLSFVECWTYTELWGWQCLCKSVATVCWWSACRTVCCVQRKCYLVVVHSPPSPPDCACFISTLNLHTLLFQPLTTSVWCHLPHIHCTYWFSGVQNRYWRRQPLLKLSGRRTVFKNC